jgi:hypothetical protein
MQFPASVVECGFIGFEERKYLYFNYDWFSNIQNIAGGA